MPGSYDPRLIEAARVAGLGDPDLLQLAREDCSPLIAVGDLRRRFPAAFAPARPTAAGNAAWEKHIAAGETLAGVASEFGAHDPGIVAHARGDLPARQAMEELRKQFPDAFKPVFDARTATRAEVKLGWTRLQQERARRDALVSQTRELAAMDKRFAGRK